MKVFKGYWQDFSDSAPSVVTVGSFDGIHLGHRSILDRVIESAKANHQQSAVISFEPHPRKFFSDSIFPLLTTTEEKIELLEKLGINLAVILNFDEKFSKVTAQEFVQFFLKARVGITRMILGYNHSFGKDGSGDRESLISMSKSMNFSLEVVNPIQNNQIIVSSSEIRNLLSVGKVYETGELLGRFYGVSGIVVHGFGRGKRLNYPTANLGFVSSDKLIPKDGIYAGLALMESQTYPAAISVGYNPTFTERKHSIEAHLLNFDRDIYDQPIEIQFVERLRSEKKFTSEAELTAQIGEDTKQCADILRLRGLMKEEYIPFKSLQ